MNQDINGNRSVFLKEVDKVSWGNVESFNNIKDKTGRLIMGEKGVQKALEGIF